MTLHYNRSSEKKNRKRLRFKQTDAEMIVWNRLRNRNFLNIKFRRQYSVDAFILDFYAPEIKLAVEIDGGIHKNKDQKDYDKERQKYLEGYGIKFIRITNEELFENANIAMKKIEKEIKRIKADFIPSLPTSRDRLSPYNGEGEIQRKDRG